LAEVYGLAVAIARQPGERLVWDDAAAEPPITDAVLDRLSQRTGATINLYLRGRLVATSDRTPNGTPALLRESPVARSMRDMVTGNRQTYNEPETIAGDVWYSHHAPVYAPSGEVIGVFSAFGPRANFDAWVEAIQEQIVLTATPIVALLGLIAWFALGRVFRGFDRVRRALGDLSAGKLAITVPYADARDEVGAIARVAVQYQESSLKLTKLEEMERKRAEEAQHLSLHDSLTGLPNRRQALQILEDRLSEPNAAGAISLLDLDQFKEVNDTLGHHIGDRLLEKVARRLRNALVDGSAVARLGGDEFAWFHPPGVSGALITNCTDRVIEAMSRPFPVGPHEIRIGVSVGTAAYPSDGNDAGTLLRNADIAMYRAKAEGRNTARRFKAEYALELEEHRTLVDALAAAIEADQIEVVYQPKVLLANGVIGGVEALARWRHPERGPISPVVFIPIAERSGLIVALGEAVLRRSCLDMVALTAAGGPAIPVAVNLSGIQMKRPDVVERILAILAETGLPPERLELELTESSAIEDAETVIQLMQRLSGLGISLSIDDFGTGYSSLSQLHRFEVDKVKIDRSFVTPLGSGGAANHDAEAVVRAIVGLGHALGLAIIAEGIETEAQAERLAAMGVQLAQGWLYAKAMPPSDLRNWIVTRENALNQQVVNV
jgi:diguanylate cyclase (GGDEF)-like protein